MRQFEHVSAEQKEEYHQEYCKRISKILLSASMDDLSMDQDLLGNMPVNSDEPRFIAAEVFADTMLEVGMGEDISQMARTAFYCLKMNKEENTEQKI